MDAHCKQALKRYQQLGLVAYVEHRIKMFEDAHFRKPGQIMLGRLQWITVLENHPLRLFAIAGVNCVPVLEEPSLVELS